MARPGEGLSADEIEQEVAVPLPEREAMSLIDPVSKLVPIGNAVPGDGPPTVAEEPPLDT